MINKINNNSNLSNITQKWVNVITPFLKDYGEKMTASEISKISKIPQQTASRELNKLVKLNLINYTINGKNKLFYLNFEKETSRILIQLAEAQKSLSFALKNKRIYTIINELIKKCEGLIVFGSYASGKFNEESDFDIIIVGKFEKNNIKRIIENQGLNIHEHYSSFEEFKKILKKKNPLAVEISKDHILFGDTSRIINIFLLNKHG